MRHGMAKPATPKRRTKAKPKLRCVKPAKPVRVGRGKRSRLVCRKPKTVAKAKPIAKKPAKAVPLTHQPLPSGQPPAPGHLPTTPIAAAHAADPTSLADQAAATAVAGSAADSSSPTASPGSTGPTSRSGDAESGPATSTVDSPIAKYTGTFGPREAERLLWRAGFGPVAGEARRLAEAGMDAAVLAMTRPTTIPVLRGPEPTDEQGRPLAPYDIWQHDQLFWFDRMVRTDQPLIERLALVFHDWFATSNVSVLSQRLMLDQTDLFRSHCLGSFREMVRDVTRDPAMVVFLNSDQNRRDAVNENYGRELMELFTLGADRGAYTETDVREIARALTGWTSQRTPGNSPISATYDAARHDPGVKTIFGRSGRFDWEDAARMVIEHPLHASFFVTKLWGYFIPTAPSDEVVSRLSDLYVSSGNQIRPVLEAILTSRELYEGPSMVKPPAVLIAGMLRLRRPYIRGEDWPFVSAMCGQRLYYPPDVSGWNDQLWMSTNAMLWRWNAASEVITVSGGTLGSPTWGAYDPTETAETAIADALASWDEPVMTDATLAILADLARDLAPAPREPQSRAQRHNALLQMVPGSPDYQVC